MSIDHPRLRFLEEHVEQCEHVGRIARGGEKDGIESEKSFFDGADGRKAWRCIGLRCERFKRRRRPAETYCLLS